MLIICNGAFKSGSTWVHAIVRTVLKLRGVELAAVPEHYRRGKSPVSVISEANLARFIEREDIQSNTYLTKAHFFREETLAGDYPADVRFLFVERDLRDAVVSHYHHLRVYRNWKLGFKLYYLLIGRFKAYEIWLFNQRCKKYFGPENFLRYEEMKQDIAPALDKICRIIDQPAPNDAERQAIVEETSLDSMRKQARKGSRDFYHGAGERNAELFRKGQVGDYQNYFYPAALTDIAKISAGSFSSMSRAVYSVLFTFRRQMR